MNYKTLLNAITPEIYHSLKRAVEIGKWPDGRPLTSAQREHCLQAVIAYDAQHKPREEQVGYIHPKPHSHCQAGEAADADKPQPIKWQ